MIAGRRCAFWSLAVLAFLGVAGCKSRDLGMAGTSTRSSNILGGDSFDATRSQVLTARGVGWIGPTSRDSPAGSCTASPIMRDVVLTAAHCMCPPGGNPDSVATPVAGCAPDRPSGTVCQIAFHLPYPDPVTGAI